MIGTRDTVIFIIEMSYAIPDDTKEGKALLSWHKLDLNMCSLCSSRSKLAALRVGNEMVSHQRKLPEKPVLFASLQLTYY